MNNTSVTDLDISNANGLSSGNIKAEAGCEIHRRYADAQQDTCQNKVGFACVEPGSARFYLQCQRAP